MRRSNLIILLLALAMGGIAAFMAQRWIERHTTAQPEAAKATTVVVAATPLAFGTVLTAENVSEISWTGQQLPEGVFASKAELFKDGRRVVLNAIDKSELVLRTKVTAPGQRASLSVLLEEGMRAVTVRVDDVRGVAGFILPGDRVDVMLLRTETRKGETENSADVLIQYVKVLAIDQLANERQDQPAIATVAKAVTLQVNPEQAQKILLAGNIGKLSLVLRQPAEGKLAEGGRITDGDLGPAFARRDAKPTPSPVTEKQPVAEKATPPLLEAFKSDTVKVTIFHGTDEKKYEVIHQGKEQVSEANAGAGRQR